MTNLEKIKEKKLPAIKDLYKGEIVEVKAQNDLIVLLNQEPNPQWLKKHPMANTLYIPIARIEYLLTAIFIQWRVEIKSVQLIANSVVVTVTLHVLNPVTNEWQQSDGLGAAPIQTDKDASATDWTKVKSDGVMKGAPAAESYAIKDAAEKLGKLFGKDLNRADSIMYDSLLGKFEDPIHVKIKQVTEKLETYSGEDKEDLREMLKEKKKAGELTPEVLDNILEQVS